MRCNICNRLLNEPHFNSDIENYDPCDTCMEVIEAAIGGFTYKTTADEDDFGLDPVILDLLSPSPTPLPDDDFT